jgi:hypothetical protein
MMQWLRTVLSPAPTEEFHVAPVPELKPVAPSRAQGMYYTFLASLPPLPNHFKVERPPISREQLREHMTMLPPDDQEMLHRFCEILHELQRGSSVPDEVLLDQLERDWHVIPSRMARYILEHQLVQTYLLTALQRKMEDMEPPLGPDPLRKQIQMYWSQAGFRLQPHYPWIEEIPRLLQEAKVMDIHRLLLQTAWDYWKTIEEHYSFSLEAFLLYLARWNIIDQWHRLDASRGRQKAQEFFKEQLDDHPIRFE